MLSTSTSVSRTGSSSSTMRIVACGPRARRLCPLRRRDRGGGTGTESVSSAAFSPGASMDALRGSACGAAADADARSRQGGIVGRSLGGTEWLFIDHFTDQINLLKMIFYPNRAIYRAR